MVRVGRSLPFRLRQASHCIRTLCARGSHQLGVYFVVDDAYAGAVRVEKLGGTVVREVTESSFGPVAPVADPGGAVVMIIGPMSAA